MVLGKLYSHMQKSETGLLAYIIHKNQLKMVHIFKHRVENKKFLEENIGGTFFDPRI